MRCFKGWGNLGGPSLRLSSSLPYCVAADWPSFSCILMTFCIVFNLLLLATKQLDQSFNNCTVENIETHLSLIQPVRVCATHCEETAMHTLGSLDDGRPGPNSGHTNMPRIAGDTVSSIHHRQLSHEQPDEYGGEGYLLTSWGKVETGFTAADLQRLFPVKQQDKVPPWSYGSQRCLWTSCMRSTTKRSFRRAHNRALADGYAWYRGHHIPLSAFPVTTRSISALPNKPKRAQPRLEHPRQAPLNRLNVLHTNVGGLATSRWEELQYWAQIKDIDVLVLTESRWQFSSDWENQKWFCIHSGTEQDKSNGILIMIRKTVCDASKIGVSEYIPGRLIHLRFHYRSRAFDLLACYQYVDNRSLTNKSNRQYFWAQLHQCMCTVPNRNSVLIAGDFNCSLHQDGHHVGTSSFRWHNSRQTGRSHPDAVAFHDFLHKFDLTALNSWDAKAPPTFCHGHVASRIDFFLTRHADSDCYSKQITYHPDADFLPTSGPMHIPMICTVKKIPYVFTKAAGPLTCTYRQRLTCRAAWQHQDSNWMQMIHTLHSKLDHFQMQSHNPQDFIDNLHQTLMPTLQNFFPKTQRNRSEPQNTDLVESKWTHRRKLLEFTHPNTSNLFKARYHLTRFQCLKKAHNLHIKTMKKQQMHDLLREVDQAAAAFDSFHVFSIINRYTPKQPRKKIRLRREDGAPASFMDVQRLTSDFIRTKWDGPDTLEMDINALTHIPFTEDDLAAEIARIPAVKSVASHFMPGLIFKNMSSPIAALIYEQLRNWWIHNDIFVPSQWKNAWVAFLPKPPKMPSKLENLRAIALMEPLGKTVLGLITKQFKQQLHPIVAAWPQFAYIEHRSASDAIRRVAAHCTATRTLLRNQQRTVHQRAAKVPSYTICGGIQMFIDISRAFDEIPRQPLFDHLRTLPINQDHVTILGQWHSNTEYITNHDGQFVNHPTKCGIRQGCRAAPVLWTGFTNLLFEALSHELDPAWIKRTVTIYADDIHSGDQFFSEQELRNLLQHFGTLLDVIERHGLHISLNKSMLLISFGGTSYRRLQHDLVQRGDQGFFILIPRADGSSSKLPVQKTASYLGVQMTYANFEHLTLSHRMTAAKTTMFRLRRWLRTRHIQQKTKLHLWHSCIYTTLIYGLFASNITFIDLYKIHTYIMISLRQVTGNHSFQSGLTHAQFLQTYKLHHPFAMLLHSLAQLRRLQCQRLIHLTTQDILHTIDWTNLTQLEMLIQTAWNAQDHHMDQQIPQTDEVQIKYFSCNWCQLRFHSLPNLRRHQTQAHGVTQLRTHEVTLASYSQNGLPCCMNCHKMFSTWRSFSIHLERNCCQAIPGMASSSTSRPHQDPETRWLNTADLALLMSKPYGAALVQAVQHGHWSPLRAMTQAHEDLAHYCILCGVYHGRPQELNMHIRTQHRKFVANIYSKAAQLGRAQASISPCFFCDKTFVRQHQCTFWTQIALLAVNMQPAGDGPCTDHNLRCEICRQQYETMQALNHHLFSDHKLEIQDWLPTRDLLAADPVCAHCLSCFASRSDVRHHIIRGLCSNFDAARPIEEMPVSSTWTNIITTGDMDSLRNSPMMRLSMTLHCQLCGARFERQQDLALHLQTVHADRWMRTQTTMHLLAQVGQLTTSCICNPQTHARGLSHVCPAYRQLTMLAQKVEHELFLPWTFDDAGTRRLLYTVQNHAVIDIIVNLLLDRKFSELWTNLSACQLFRTTCLICGGTFHPAVLCEHVKAMHSHECTWIPEILPQLLPAFMQHQSHDFQCNSCELIFNLPMTEACTEDQLQQRQQLAQIHAQHHCPVIYQIGLLLTHGLPSRARSADERCRGTGSLQGDGTPADDRQVHPRPKRRKRTQKTQEGAQSGIQHADNGSDQVGSAHGQHAAETGCRPPIDEKARLLRLLSSNSCASPSATAVDEGEGVACPAEATPAGHRGFSEVCPLEECPVSGSGDALGRSSAQTVTIGATGCTVDDGIDSWGDHQRGQLPLSTLEFTATNPDSAEEGSHHNAQNAEIYDPAEADLLGSHSGAEISRSTSIGGPADSAMDSPNRHETRRTSGTSREPSGIDGLGIDWGNYEASHSSPKQAGPGTSDDVGQRQGQTDGQSDTIQREGQSAPAQLTWESSDLPTLRAGFEHMILLNLTNWCYANTAFLTLTWAMLSCTAFSNLDWGPLGHKLVHFLQHASHQTSHLPDVDWFQQILTSWEGEGAQGDPVEFMTHMLQGLGLSGLDWTWERRVQLGAATSVRDKSDRLTPITLHLDPELSHAGWIRLDTMIQTWANYLGMSTALCQHTPLVCFHIDRHVMTGTGDTYKSDLSIGLHGVFSIPFFIESNTEVEWLDYSVIAAIAHLGNDQTGHCRAILRVQQDTTSGHEPYMHLLTDDNAIPSRCWREPSWFLQNVICVWLCHVDLLDLHACDNTSHASLGPSTNPGIMQLLHHFD